LTIAGSAPVIVAQRLRRGACSSPRGGKRLIADAVKTARRLLEATTPILVRMDSAFYGRNAVHAALAGGAQVSVTIRMDQRVKAAIASIGEDAWTTIEYTDAVFDEASGQWISRAEVAEIDFTEFTPDGVLRHPSFVGLRKNKPARGYVVSIHPTTEYPKIKPLGGIEDDRVLVPPTLMELARWMSRYYVTPLGTVIDSVIPAALATDGRPFIGVAPPTRGR
jgi:hypothetical protein